MEDPSPKPASQAKATSPEAKAQELSIVKEL